MGVGHSPKKKRTRSESNEVEESQANEENAETSERESTQMSANALYNVVMSNNAMIKELKEMLMEQRKINELVKLELEELKVANNRLMNMMESKETRL